MSRVCIESRASSQYSCRHTDTASRHGSNLSLHSIYLLSARLTMTPWQDHHRSQELIRKNRGTCNCCSPQFKGCRNRAMVTGSSSSSSIFAMASPAWKTAARSHSWGAYSRASGWAWLGNRELAPGTMGGSTVPAVEMVLVPVVPVVPISCLVRGIRSSTVSSLSISKERSLVELADHVHVRCFSPTVSHGTACKATACKTCPELQGHIQSRIWSLAETSWNSVSEKSTKTMALPSVVRMGDGS